MTAGSRAPIASIAALVTTLFASAALAQTFSPHFKTTGRGAYDLYNDTVLCSAVLERAIQAGPESERRAQLEKGIDYTVNFALFLLESGNVVDMSGAVLAPDNLPVDRRNAHNDWRAVVYSLEEEGKMPDAGEAEVARCLSLFGHDWE
jgi:hypothetical protein